MTQLDVRPATLDELIEAAERMEQRILWQNAIELAKTVYGEELHSVGVYYDWEGNAEAFSGFGQNGRDIRPDPRGSRVKELLLQNVTSFMSDGVYHTGTNARNRINELYVALDNDEDAGDLEPYVNMSPQWIVRDFRRSRSHRGVTVTYTIDNPPAEQDVSVYVTV